MIEILNYVNDKFKTIYVPDDKEEDEEVIDDTIITIDND